MNNSTVFHKNLAVRLKEVIGLKNNKDLIENDMSVNIPFMLIKGYKKNATPICRKSTLNIIAPERSTLILGKPGSGKTTGFLREFLLQGIKKGFSVVNYDYNFPTLTDIAYSNFKENQKKAYSKYTNGGKFACININYPEYSDRCNPISRESLESMKDVIDVVHTIFYNIGNRRPRNDQFFIDSAISITIAALWFLREYQNGKYCTYPHLIELIQQPDEELLPLLFPIFNTFSLPYFKTISDAFEKKDFEQLYLQAAPVRIPLMKSITPEMYWVMTDPDKLGINLKVNLTEEVTVLNIANNPATQNKNAPAIGLYLSQAAKLVNVQERVPCAFILDELASIYINELDHLIATSRRSKVCTVLIAQSLEQIELTYGKQKAIAFYSVVGNFISQNQELNTPTINTSVSFENNISTHNNSRFKEGEFGGVVSGSHKNNTKDKSFRGFFKDSTEEGKSISFPKKQIITSQMLQDNMTLIQNQIKQIFTEERNIIQ